MNFSTFVVLLVLLTAMYFAVKYVTKQKSCTGGCCGCKHNGECHNKNDKQIKFGYKNKHVNQNINV